MSCGVQIEGTHGNERNMIYFPQVERFLFVVRRIPSAAEEGPPGIESVTENLCGSISAERYISVSMNKMKF